jgi:hypothetical protein
LFRAAALCACVLRRQVLQVNQPQQLLQVLVNHLESVKRILNGCDDAAEVRSLLKNCQRTCSLRAPRAQILCVCSIRC